VTFGFVYVTIFLLGFTLALVGGLARRVLHPSELCGDVVAPSHEHWAGLHTPTADVVVSFLTLFGLVTFFIRGFTNLATTKELAIGTAAGLLGAVVLRVWFRAVCDPSRRSLPDSTQAVVVRDIPALGFGQIEVTLGRSRIKLAARSSSEAPIAAGTLVHVLDQRESVVVVSPR